MKPEMTRAQFYCPLCRNNPATPCDAHKAGYERMLALMQRDRPSVLARVRRWLGK